MTLVSGAAAFLRSPFSSRAKPLATSASLLSGATLRTWSNCATASVVPLGLLVDEAEVEAGIDAVRALADLGLGEVDLLLEQDGAGSTYWSR